MHNGWSPGRRSRRCRSNPYCWAPCCLVGSPRMSPARSRPPGGLHRCRGNSCFRTVPRRCSSPSSSCRSRHRCRRSLGPTCGTAGSRRSTPRTTFRRKRTDRSCCSAARRSRTYRSNRCICPRRRRTRRMRRSCSLALCTFRWMDRGRTLPRNSRLCSCPRHRSWPRSRWEPSCTPFRATQAWGTSTSPSRRCTCPRCGTGRASGTAAWGPASTRRCRRRYRDSCTRCCRRCTSCRLPCSNRRTFPRSNRRNPSSGTGRASCTGSGCSERRCRSSTPPSACTRW